MCLHTFLSLAAAFVVVGGGGVVVVVAAAAKFRLHHAQALRPSVA